MKTFLFTISLALATFILNAQNSDNALSEGTDVSNGITITVTVPVPSDKGQVVVGLYDEATFMKAAPLQGLESDIIEGIATVTFTNVLPGTYAITLFHDKNGNKQMDFEPNGMPIEMYGVSNNVMSFGPPQWSDAKFDVENEPLSFDIIM